MSRSISLPEDVIRQAEELAARVGVSLEEWVAAALADRIAGAEYLRKRAERASVDRFRRALDRIPDVEPEPHDRLQ